MKHKFYTTAIVDGIMNGYKNPSELFYRNVYGFRKPHIIFHHTYEELNEYAKCKNDPIYFFEAYCKIFSPNGQVNIKLRQYQKDLLNDYFNHRFNVTASSRQTGITTVECLLMLHEIVFNSNKTVYNIGLKLQCAQEMLNKVKQMYIQLPFFLKPGVTDYDVRSLCLDNGSKLVAITPNTGVDKKVDSVFIDNYAFFPPTYTEYVRNMFPTIVGSNDTKLFITSTPNGYNHFYDLVQSAERGLNNFVLHKIHWWEVEGRDEQWKQQHIAMLGSEKLFNQEFN